MKAIVADRYGGSEVLSLVDIAAPIPGPGEVRVRNRAVGIVQLDAVRVRGENANIEPRVSLPYTPGNDGAGIVEVVGEGAEMYGIGDRVAYVSRATPGGYADASVVPADRLIRLPDDIAFEDALVLLVSGMTCHYIVNDLWRPRPGSTVLVHAAAGGFGLALVQWAKHMGCRVFGTVSNQAKAKAIREAGADAAIIYTETDFVEEVHRLTNGRGVDFVSDSVGGTTFIGSIAAAAIRGHIVLSGQPGGLVDSFSPYALQKKSLTLTGAFLPHFIFRQDEYLARANAVFEAARSGWLSRSAGHRMALADAAKAYRLLETRQSIGKILLVPD
jgi:NADPH2:quinone reductase